MMHTIDSRLRDASVFPIHHEGLVSLTNLCSPKIYKHLDCVVEVDRGMAVAQNLVGHSLATGAVCDILSTGWLSSAIGKWS